MNTPNSSFSGNKLQCHSVCKLRNSWCQLPEIPHQSSFSQRAQILLFCVLVRVSKTGLPAVKSLPELWDIPWQNKRGDRAGFKRREKTQFSQHFPGQGEPNELGQSPESSSEYNVSTAFTRDEISFLSSICWLLNTLERLRTGFLHSYHFSSAKEAAGGFLFLIIAHLIWPILYGRLFLLKIKDDSFRSPGF